jgi:hypothetical protein
MKNIIYTLVAAVFMLATTNSATAQNFTNSLVALSIVSGNFDTNLEANNAGITELSFGYTTLQHNLAAAAGSVRLSLGTTGTAVNNIYAEAEYNLSVQATSSVDIYAGTALRYQVGGIWTVRPSVGVSYSIADNISLFAEVNHGWSFANSFAPVGGEALVGVDYRVTKNFTITPAIVRSFNTGADTTNFRLQAKASF